MPRSTEMFDVNKFYRIELYDNDGYTDWGLRNGFLCRMIARHCEYDKPSGLWINHRNETAYDITEAPEYSRK